jgi:hypothetical protein
MAHLIKFREIKMLNYSHSNAKFLSEKPTTLYHCVWLFQLHIYKNIKYNKKLLNNIPV